MDRPASSSQRPAFDLGLLNALQADVRDMAGRLGHVETLDLLFLAYLRRMARFGYFHYGPITIDVRLVEEIVENTAARDAVPDTRAYDEHVIRFTQALITEVHRTGGRRVDELHVLLAFMRCGEGLPARVFGELGVTPVQVEQVASSPGRAEALLERLYSPEEVAEYLGVHVQTVRAWIRSGRLPARRLAGQRALRIRESDIHEVLEPLDPET